MQRDCASQPSSRPPRCPLRLRPRGGFPGIFVAALLGIGCSPTTKTDVGAGIGSPAKATIVSGRPLHAARRRHQATGGICATTRLVDTDCLAGSVCAKGMCQLPLTVGVALTGNVTELEGWTFAHVQGLTRPPPISATSNWISALV